jgi:hypothetical protein
LAGALAPLAACNTKVTEVDCTANPTASVCGPLPVASATLTIVRAPNVVGDTTIGIATATTTRGTAFAQPTYNGANIANAGNPASFQHAPAAGSAVYGARAVQTPAATLHNAADQTFTVAPIDATSTIDKTTVALGDSVCVTVAAQVGRDSVVVSEGSARRASFLEGGGSVFIKPAAAGTTTITTKGFNGTVTQTGSTHTVTVQ